MKKNNSQVEIIKTNRVDQLYTAIGDRVSTISSAEQIYKKSDFVIKPDKVIDHAIMFGFLCSCLVVTMAYIVNGSVTPKGYAFTGFVFAVTGIIAYVTLMVVATTPQEHEEIMVMFDHQQGKVVEMEQPEIRLEIANGNRINYHDLPMTNQQLIAMCNHLAGGGRVTRNQFVANGISTKNGYTKLYNALVTCGLIAVYGKQAEITDSMLTLIDEMV